MASTPVTNFRLPLALRERIDEARGEEPRTAWLVRAAEALLEATQTDPAETPGAAAPER